jgi:hypothetical protein
VNLPGAYDAWYSVVPQGYAFEPRVQAAAGLTLLLYDAASRTRYVRCPLLVCVSDRETLMDPAIAVRVANEAPRGVARHYDTDHFQVYHPSYIDRIVADQIEFLTEHLRPLARPVARDAAA